jgi:signal peptidase
VRQDVEDRAPGARPGEETGRNEAVEPAEASRRPLWLRALRGVLAVVSFLALCLAILAALVLVVLPAATGSGTYTILTSSMSPHYPPGTLMVVKPTAFDQLGPGDVITYQIESGRPEVVSHRIVSLAAGQDGETMLVTQGDNNSEPDAEPVREVQVRGKLFFAVPYVGHVASWLGHQDRGIAGQALAVALIGYGVCAFVSAGVARRRRGRHVPRAAPAGEPGEGEEDGPGR